MLGQNLAIVTAVIMLPLSLVALKNVTDPKLYSKCLKKTAT